MTEIDFGFIAVAAFGAFMQELLHWYELRERLALKRYQTLIKSAGYWLITIITIGASGVGIWLLFGEDNLSVKMQFIAGAAFPLIFKKLVKSFGGKNNTQLGRAAVFDYFDLNINATAAKA